MSILLLLAAGSAETETNAPKSEWWQILVTILGIALIVVAFFVYQKAIKPKLEKRRAAKEAARAEMAGDSESDSMKPSSAVSDGKDASGAKGLKTDGASDKSGTNENLGFDMDAEGEIVAAITAAVAYILASEGGASQNDLPFVVRKIRRIN